MFQSLSATLKSNLLFLILAGVFLGTTIFHLSFVPIWDGWVFLQCYQSFAETGSTSCVGHSAIVPTVLFGLTQIFSPGSCQWVYLLGAILGLVGLIYFSLLLKYFFGDSLSSAERSLTVFLFGLNPIFLAQIIQPNLDTSLAVFFVIFLYLLLSQKIVLAALFGVLMVFTKETGFVIYGASILLYLFLFWGSRLRQAAKWEDVVSATVLSLPVVLFGFYMAGHPPHFSLGKWSSGISMVFSWGLINDFLLAQLAVLCMINFNWIPTLFILRRIFLRRISLEGAGSAQMQQRGFRNVTDRTYVYLLFVSLVFLLTRINFVNNPRYVLPLLPLFIILFSEASLMNIKKKKARMSVLLVLIMLIYGSAFRTWDPVGKLIFGTFKFGSHDVLKMARFNLWKEHWARDEFVYNYEFTQLPLLTEKIVNKFGLDKIYTADPGFTFEPLNLEDFSLYNPQTKHRTANRKNSIRIKFLDPRDILSGHFPEVYFIEYPNTIYMRTLREGIRVFDVQETTVVENNGYAISVLHLVAKNR